MSTAFELTLDDVHVVMNNHGCIISEEDAVDIFYGYIIPNEGVIEKSALRGDDMDEQTDYAHQEIKNIFEEAGLFKKYKG
jgi:hypothetical protein